MMTTKSSEAVPSVLILVAAGKSSRMGGKKKEYLPLKNGTVLSTAARTFLQTLPFSIVAVTYPASEATDDKCAAKNDERQRCAAALFADDYVKHADAQFLFVPGGSTRQESVLHALDAVSNALSAARAPCNPLVFIHDGARPFVSSACIEACYKAAQTYGAAVPALPPTDTQKEIDGGGFIVRHLVRANLAAVQTPQVFRLQPLLTAHHKADACKRMCTDDTEIWDAFAVDAKQYHGVKIIPSSSENRKITYPSDVPGAQGAPMTIRTGLGYDKHRLVEGRALMLGGKAIPFEKGEDGHSDGDVLLHAITDALLGAAALGDIGSYFPPEDPQWKDADSKKLLSTVWKDIRAAGFSLGNLDCVVALEKPKFLPWRDEVRTSIADVLGVAKEQIFVKAKTGEKTGDVGTGKVVEAFATCLLLKNENA